MSKDYRNKAIGLRDMMDSLGLYSLMRYNEIMNANDLVVKNDKGDRVWINIHRKYTVFRVLEPSHEYLGIYTLADDVAEEVKAILCE